MVHEVREAIIDPYYRIPFNFEGNTFEDISNKQDVQSFIEVHLITRIFNNTVKDYSDRYGERDHWLNEFNKFLGMRMTLKKIELKPNTEGGYQEQIPSVRKDSYDGRTSKSQKYVDKEPHGAAQTPYSNTGGYNNKGGHIFYF